MDLRLRDIVFLVAFEFFEVFAFLEAFELVEGTLAGWQAMVEGRAEGERDGGPLRFTGEGNAVGVRPPPIPIFMDEVVGNRLLTGRAEGPALRRRLG
jgi:hypothetical protein